MAAVAALAVKMAQLGHLMLTVNSTFKSSLLSTTVVCKWWLPAVSNSNGSWPGVLFYFYFLVTCIYSWSCYPTQDIFPLFLQFGLNDLLYACGGGLSREGDVDRKVSRLCLDTVEKSPSHYRLHGIDTQKVFITLIHSTALCLSCLWVPKLSNQSSLWCLIFILQWPFWLHSSYFFV